MLIDFKKAYATNIVLLATGAGAALQNIVQVKEGNIQVTHYKIDAYLAATNGTDIQGALPPNAGSATSGANSFNLQPGRILAKLTIGDHNVHSTMCPLPVFGGWRDNDGILIDPWEIPLNSNVTLDVQNNTGLNITVALRLGGYRTR